MLRSAPPELVPFKMQFATLLKALSSKQDGTLGVFLLAAEVNLCNAWTFPTKKNGWPATLPPATIASSVSPSGARSAETVGDDLPGRC